MSPDVICCETCSVCKLLRTFGANMLGFNVAAIQCHCLTSDLRNMLGLSLVINAQGILGPRECPEHSGQENEHAGHHQVHSAGWFE